MPEELPKEQETTAVDYPYFVQEAPIHRAGLCSPGIGPGPLISMDKMRKEHLKYFPCFADLGKPKPLNWSKMWDGARSRKFLGIE